MTPKDIKTALEQHKLWLEDSSKGAKADLSGADLDEASLRGADLRGADLRGANLSGASLSGANLSGANLHEANLHEADLYRADLNGANLSGASLSGADLRRASLSEASLSGAVGPAGFKASEDANSLLYRCAAAGACTDALIWLWAISPTVTEAQVRAVAPATWVKWFDDCMPKETK